ncbi:MAG: helicase C-terminal domain-containing protein [Halioglobus sp.]
MTEMTISVTELTAFCHRSGDIDYRFRPSPTGVQGTEGHQRVYRNRPASYQPEFPVEYHLEGGLTLRGRADGYDRVAGIVEEIKTCRVHPNTIPESITRQHMAQARLYAAMIAQSEDLEELTVRLTWFNIDDESEVTLEQVYAREELSEFLAQSLQKFSAWLASVTRLRQARDTSIEKFKFPHAAFRAGQRDIAELVYKCIDQGGQLLLEAPTGIGKTAAVLFPAIKALGSGKHERIAFLTAKSVGRKMAEDTLHLFHDAGYRGGAISLTAKEKICLSPGKACHGDDCPYARNYYDKLPAAMLAAIQQPVLRRQELEELGRQFEVCPYQLALDLLPWIDVIVGDLHYMYGLPAVLGASVEDPDQRWSALIDEAHNLPSRARGMYSASLAKIDVLKARATSSTVIAKSLNRINRLMLDLQKSQWLEPDFESLPELPPGLVEALKRFVSDCGEEQAGDASVLHRQPDLLGVYFSILHFLRVAENWGEDFRFELSRNSGKQSLQLQLNCLDPARLLAKQQEPLHSLTAFSATLSPRQWMQSALGLRAETVYRRQESPFCADQLQVSIATHIDTRFKQRASSMVDLAVVLRQWLDSVPGNCIVYFPSYRYLRDTLERVLAGNDLQSQRSVWVQEPQQSEEARAELLVNLEARQNMAAFCILGGVFGEGIDLPGERLASVVVVGVGLPQVNRDTEQLREYFERQYGHGFNYAYLYPGMQKVDQAMGRVIRRLDDRGQALIIDQRYRLSEYRNLLPPWWTYQSFQGS